MCRNCGAQILTKFVKEFDCGTEKSLLNFRSDPEHILDTTFTASLRLLLECGLM